MERSSAGWKESSCWGTRQRIPTQADPPAPRAPAWCWGGLGRPPNFPPHLFIKLPWRCTEHGHGAQRCRLTAGGISSSRLSPCLERARCWHLPQNLGICTPLGAGATRQMNLNRCTFASVPAWLSPVVQDVASRSTELQQQELTRGNLFLLTGVFWKHWMASGQKGLLLFWNKHR